MSGRGGVFSKKRFDAFWAYRSLSLSLSQLVHYEEHFVNGGSYSLSRSEYEIDNNVGRTSRPRLCLQKVFFFFLLTKFSLTFFFSLLYINV